MKVVHIIPSLEKGGAERLAIDMCHAMGSLPGVEVVLVTLGSKIAYQVENKKFTLVHIPARVQLSIWRRNRFFVQELERFIRGFQPDIIHSHLFEAEIISRSIDYRQAKYFSHLHSKSPQFRRFNLLTLFSKKGLTEFYERRYLIKRYRYLGGNRFIAIAQSTLNYIKEVMPVDLRKAYLLPNAIDIRRFKRKTPFQEKPQHLRLVNIGRLNTNKNQLFLIEVVKYLHGAGIPATLDLMGDGPDRQMLEQRTAAYQLNSHIRFHGNVDQVEQILWECDLYVHSAFSEAFGLVFLEAMAAGLPVLAIDGGGNRDVIRNGRNGYILPAPTVEQFAEKVKLLLNDRQAYNNLRENAIKDAGNYDIDNYAQQLVAIYKDELRTR